MRSTSSGVRCSRERLVWLRLRTDGRFRRFAQFNVWSVRITSAIPLFPPMVRGFRTTQKAPFRQSALATTPYGDRAEAVTATRAMSDKFKKAWHKSGSPRLSCFTLCCTSELSQPRTKVSAAQQVLSRAKRALTISFSRSGNRASSARKARTSCRQPPNLSGMGSVTLLRQERGAS